jgi:Xaa-Pro dipeptidase
MKDAQLHLRHVAERQRTTEAALAAANFDGLVIQSGAPFTYFVDDQDAPLRTTPHFAHWCPLEGPFHLLYIRPGAKPRLVRVAPEDYWYEQAPLGAPFWAGAFEVIEAPDVNQAWDRLGVSRHAAYIGDQPDSAEAHGILRDALNPDALVKRLVWERARKSEWEIACIEDAEEKAARGHHAARAAFLAGGSELDIHHAYAKGVGCVDRELPYETIVCLDEKGAILHYCGKRAGVSGKVLLIDAGARTHGYCSDITRTWTNDKADPRFVALVEDMDQLQLRLVERVKPGLPYLELHHGAHVLLGDLLHRHGLIGLRGDDAVEAGLTAPFFPHGLGHFLGIQVHDVGGRQKAPEGGVVPPPRQYPYLRTTRTIEEGHVFTIEPGLYFIEMLLRPHRSGPKAGLFDWKLVDQLAGHGGIRIEDNILVTKSGGRNLTRPRI